VSLCVFSCAASSNKFVFKNIWRHRLGLGISKQLIEKQGGTISVTSKINEGTTFSFTLSFKKTKIKTETMDLELDKENRVKVLVVEDIKLNQLLMKIILDDFNFKYEILRMEKLLLKTRNRVL
jgi:outer membrane protein assembly factor BamA